jgi:hypothetical protein
VNYVRPNFRAITGKTNYTILSETEIKGVATRSTLLPDRACCAAITADPTVAHVSTATAFDK